MFLHFVINKTTNSFSLIKKCFILKPLLRKESSTVSSQLDSYFWQFTLSDNAVRVLLSLPMPVTTYLLGYFIQFIHGEDSGALGNKVPAGIAKMFDNSLLPDVCSCISVKLIDQKCWLQFSFGSLVFNHSEQFMLYLYKVCFSFIKGKYCPVHKKTSKKSHSRIYTYKLTNWAATWLYPDSV